MIVFSPARERTAEGGGLSEADKAFDLRQPGGGYAVIKLLRQFDNGEVIQIFLERET
jgi:hypothetical protein